MAQKTLMPTTTTAFCTDHCLPTFPQGTGEEKEKINTVFATFFTRI